MSSARVSPVPQAEIDAAADTIDRWKKLGAELMKSEVPESRVMGRKLLDEASKTTPFKLTSDVWWTFEKAKRNGAPIHTEPLGGNFGEILAEMRGERK